MFTEWLQQLIVVAFFLPSAAVASTETPTFEEAKIVTIDAARGAQVQYEGALFHVPADSISENTELRVAQNAFAMHGENHLPKKYRSHDEVYEFVFDTDAEDVIVELDYTAKGKDKKRKHVLYRANEEGRWIRLRTLVDKQEQTVQATLPHSSGMVVVAKHRYKKERPIKRSSYSQFPGTPISDTAAVLDVKSGKFLYRQKAKKQRPVASLTKLATSLVFLEDNPNLSSTVTYSKKSDREGATVDVKNGDILRLNDVLMGTLLPSANNMAETLSRSTSFERGDFITQMNNRAQEMKLRRTKFVEPTGLNAQNVSTAGNMAKLGRNIFRKYPDTFFRAAQLNSHKAVIQNTGEEVWMPSTNRFDGKGRYTLTAFKTGYYPGIAERTLVAQIRDEHSGGEVIVVLFGNPQYGTINDEAYSLADWAFTNWYFHNY